MSLNSPSLDSEVPLPPPTLDSVLGKLGNPGKYQVNRKIQGLQHNLDLSDIRVYTNCF